MSRGRPCGRPSLAEIETESYLRALYSGCIGGVTRTLGLHDLTELHEEGIEWR